MFLKKKIVYNKISIGYIIGYKLGYLNITLLLCFILVFKDGILEIFFLSRWFDVR
jgi:hypothetical protein